MSSVGAASSKRSIYVVFRGTSRPPISCIVRPVSRRASVMRSSSPFVLVASKAPRSSSMKCRRSVFSTRRAKDDGKSRMRVSFCVRKGGRFSFRFSG